MTRQSAERRATEQHTSCMLATNASCTHSHQDIRACPNIIAIFMIGDTIAYGSTSRRDVEPTNNESERSLRPSVIFRKVTNGFRSEWGAKVYADLCSIVATGRRNGRNALDAIRDALAPA